MQTQWHPASRAGTPQVVRHQPAPGTPCPPGSRYGQRGGAGLICRAVLIPFIWGGFLAAACQFSKQAHCQPGRASGQRTLSCPWRGVLPSCPHAPGLLVSQSSASRPRGLSVTSEEQPFPCGRSRLSAGEAVRLAGPRRAPGEALPLLCASDCPAAAVGRSPPRAAGPWELPDAVLPRPPTAPHRLLLLPT